jgi:LydA holin phage, holin superfamily III
MRNLLNDWDHSTWLLAFCMSVAGGLVNWFSRLKQGKTRPFNIVELFGEIFISAAIGVGTFMVLDAYGFAIGVCAGASGVAGHMGTRLLFAIEKIFESSIPSFFSKKD